ncbi:charged multivesicular body protein 6-B-like, partial [Cryptotermes secundus]|uniref:charged multivesicular body protein 6-B-like n=1 Tax=Cryptotermes secundus TaxID=105785 RepID=UPI000CD7C69B
MGMLYTKSKKPKSKVTEYDKALLQLKQQRDNIKKYQKKIEENLQNDRKLARKLLKDGQRDRAKIVLRRTKWQEEILQKTDGQLNTL